MLTLFLVYYGTTFFSNSGINNSFIVTLITNIINVVGSFPGLYMVEKWGRRPLLLFGAVGMCVSQLIAAIVGTVTTSVVANKVLIAFVCLYIFFFACSWGPVSWVVTGELFPLKARAKCLSITTATNWLLNWAIAYATPYMVNEGPGNAGLQSKMFFIWGGFCFVAIIFVYTCVYETSGLSLEQVDELYNKIPLAWKSPGFVPSLHYTDVHDVAGQTKEGDLTQFEAEPNEKRGEQDHVEKVDRV